MATVATSGLVALAAGGVTSLDYLGILDVSDTTQAPTGSWKKILFSSLLQTDTTAVTVSTPLTFTQTWSDAAVTFTGIKANITNTNSAAASLLLDLQVGGTSQWKVTRAGVVTQTGALVIAGALSGATTGTFSGAVTMTTLGATVGTFSGAVSATNGTFSGTLGVSGLSTVRKIITGDGTTATNVGLGVQSAITTAVASGTNTNILSEITQTAATTGTVIAIEGNTYNTHTSGTVVASSTITANVHVSGVGGTTTTAIGVGSGGNLAAGTITTYKAFSANAPATGATVTTAYGYYSDAVSLAATNWQLYFASSTTSGGITFRSTALATTATVGFLFIPTCAGLATGVPSPIPTGQVPLIYDSTNNKLGVYEGAWIWTAALS